MTVKDNGIGISEEELPNIFTPFFQSKNETSQRMNKRTHGLGLYICKRICESLGGNLHVESQLGKGSKFVARIRAYNVALGRKKNKNKLKINRDTIYNSSIES